MHRILQKCPLALLLQLMAGKHVLGITIRSSRVAQSKYYVDPTLACSRIFVYIPES